MNQNIDDFNAAVALVLGYLYEQFPVPEMLNIGNLIESSDVNEPARKNELKSMCGHTVIFLKEEGYLRCGTPTLDLNLFPMTVLTSKGLAALQKVPVSLKEKQRSAGEWFVDLGKDVLKETAKESVKAAVKVVLGGV
jgi:hypothetical protein